MSVPEIMKQTHKAFAPYMESLGFVRIKRKAIWIRRMKDVYHTLYFAGSRWGSGFYVSISVWTPALLEDNEQVDKKDAVKVLSSTEMGVEISRLGIGSGCFAEYGASAEENEAIFVRLIEVIESEVMPWLALFSNRESIAANLKIASDFKIDWPRELTDRLLEGRPDPFSDLFQDVADKYPYRINASDVRAYCPLSFYQSTLEEEQDLLRAGFQEIVSFLIGEGFQFIHTPEFRFLREIDGGMWQQIRFFTTRKGLYIYPDVDVWFPEWDIAFGRAQQVGPPPAMQGNFPINWSGKDEEYWPIWSQTGMDKALQRFKILYEESLVPAFKQAEDKSRCLEKFKAHIKPQAMDALAKAGFIL